MTQRFLNHVGALLAGMKETVGTAAIRTRPRSTHSLGMGRHLPMLVLILGLVLLALLLATRFGLSAFEIFVRDAGQTADPASVAVEIADIQLAVPGNMIRFANQRTGGAQEQLDLHLHWPSLTGFTAERAEAFHTPADQSSIVYVTLSAAGDTMSPQRRFRHVYPRILEDAVRESPRGHLMRRFQDGFGYDDEELLIARHPEHPLVARCEVAAGPTDAVCLTEFRTESGLEIAYRFRRALIEDWRAIDRGVRDLMKAVAAGDDRG